MPPYSLTPVLIMWAIATIAAFVIAGAANAG